MCTSWCSGVVVKLMKYSSLFSHLAPTSAFSSAVVTCSEQVFLYSIQNK